MMKKLTIFATAVLLSATGAYAAAPAEQTAEPEKKICKTQKMTGSLTRVRRTCLTQREWDRLAEGTRKNVQDLERRAGTNAGSSAAGGL